MQTWKRLWNQLVWKFRSVMFAECEHCNVHLTPGHIVQSVAIPQSPQFVALILKCPMCRDNTKLIMERAKLDAARDRHERNMNEYDEILEEARGEIMDSDGLEYLQEIWSKSPPRVEATRGACKCKTCMAKWYLNVR